MQPHSTARLPLIDAFPFAQAGKVLRGTRALASFERVQDRLSEKDGEVRYEVSGIADEAGRPALRVELSGQLQLTCQRCLGPMAFDLAVDETLVLARNEAEIEAQPDDPEAPDRIVGAREMEVGTLLEDELLLAIPFAPRHEHCREGGLEKSEAQASPFADLRGLLNRGSRARN